MTNRTMWATALSVCAIAFVGMRAEEHQRGMILSALDYVEIEQLGSQYTYALDTGTDDGRMYANVFAEDGSFGNVKGREALTKLASHHMPEQGPSYVKHFILNHAVEVSGEGVIGKEYVTDVMFGEGRVPDAITAAGVYHDKYVKTREGWRIAARRYVPAQAGNAAEISETPLDLTLRPLARPISKDRGRDRTSLTAEDYLEIQQLVNRYPYALDTGAGSGQMYGNLFTLDGVFARWSGRDTITKMAWQHMAEQGPRYTGHFITNHVIAVTPQSVVGREYVMVFKPVDGKMPGAITEIGAYEDTYEKTTDGWRFKTRTFSGLKGIQKAPLLESDSETQVSAKNVGKNKTAGLAPLDYAQIRQLCASSAYAMDSGDQSGVGFANLFVADGIVDVDGRRYEGQKALAELAQANGGPSFVLHLITNQVIKPSHEGATSESYLVQIRPGDRAHPSVLSGGGRLEDVYSRTPQGWRLKSRVFHSSKAGL